MADSDVTDGDPNYECDACGNAFHASTNETAPYSCPNCKSDNASPLNG